MRSFYLAGGTALAIQIGHRVSKDLDWFSSKNRLGPFERMSIRNDLSSTESFSVDMEQDSMMYCRLLETEISFVYQHHPLVRPILHAEGLPIASITDIGLMKLAAINSRGTRRDFIDLYCLRHYISLDRLLALAATKYADRPSFLPIAARALTYFDDAERQPMPVMLKPVQWKDVRAYCEGIARRLARRLSGLD